MTHILILATFATAGCAGDETISKFADADAEFKLVTLDGAPFDATATIAFPAHGEVIGQAPCNRYFAKQTAPYPWIGIEAIGATRMACPELDQEGAFLTALGEMTLAEVLGGTLILSNDTGREMVFTAR